jgi:hypothetical protein
MVTDVYHGMALVSDTFYIIFLVVTESMKIDNPSANVEGETEYIGGLWSLFSLCFSLII